MRTWLPLLFLLCAADGDSPQTVCVFEPNTCYGMAEWRLGMSQSELCGIPEGICLRLHVEEIDSPPVQQPAAPPKQIVLKARVIAKAACVPLPDESAHLNALVDKMKAKVQGLQTEPIEFERIDEGCSDKRSVQIVIVQV